MLRVDEPMVTLLEEALNAVSEGDLTRRALLTSALVPELLWSPDHARRQNLAAEALDLARRAGDDHVLARVLAEQSLGYDNTDPQIVGRYAAESAEIIGLATTLNDPVLLFGAYNHRILGSIWVGDRAMLDTDLDAIEALAARLRQPAIEFHTRTLRTAQTLISGRLDDAERQIAELGEYQAAHRLTQTGTIGVLAFRLHYERGRLADFEPFLLQLVADQASIVTWRVALISVYASTDRLDDAREHLHMLAADDFAIIPETSCGS